MPEIQISVPKIKFKPKVKLWFRVNGKVPTNLKKLSFFTFGQIA